MHVEDEVYGSVEIMEPLLLDLLASKAVKRLRRISQAGASSLVRRGRSVTRFEHSTGVMLLTRHLGGSTLEQAAGLLHDVSHTAFSHTVDLAFGNKDDSFHESIFSSVIENSDVPAIVKKFDLTWRQLFDGDVIRLVDVPAPSLCADRIDYTLRDLCRFGHIASVQAQKFVAQLSVVNDVVVCTDQTAATEFVSWYVFLVENLFMHPLEMYAYDELASIIREAAEMGELNWNDLISTDDAVLWKLRGNATFENRLKSLQNTKDVSLDDNPGYRTVYGRARIIDPEGLVDEKIVRLSSVWPDYSSLWGNIKRISEEGQRIRAVQ